jgi:hypothetical protein
MPRLASCASGFTELHLTEGDAAGASVVAATVPTYRGEGQSFL